MAKNYTLKEAVEIIREGTDSAAIIDIGRRFPLLLHKVSTICALAGDQFVDLMSYMPDHMTANKLNTALKSGVSAETDEGEDEENTEETTAEVEAPNTDYESMSAKALWDLLGKAGKRKLAKSTKKADLVEACHAAFGSGEEAEDETESDPYDGKSAMDLYKICKSRGVKAPAKKPATFYADLLRKADLEAAEAEAEDEEEVEEAPAKPAKKAPDKKPASKTKPAKVEEDDDDDWDI